MLSRMTFTKIDRFRLNVLDGWDVCGNKRLDFGDDPDHEWIREFFKLNFYHSGIEQLEEFCQWLEKLLMNSYKIF